MNRKSVAAILAWIVICAFPLAAQNSRLVNISTKGQVGTDFNNMIGGFVIAGGPKTVLVRAIGPGLDPLGVPGTLPDPFLTLFDGANNVIATNDNWNATDSVTMSAVGAFPLPANSKDAVIVTTLQPGSYTAQISGLGTQRTGAAILEVYDVGSGGQLINLATRLQVGSGADAAAAGFVVAPGAGTRKLLIRGIGPALVAFGLPALPDPHLELRDRNQNVLASAAANGGASAVAAASTQAGAFTPTAADTALIATVTPGNYTVQLSSSSGAKNGVALVEVYDITASAGTPPGFGISPRLYYANLRPIAAASFASGYATILFDPNTNTGTVNLSFANLTSAEVVGHLVLGAGNFVFNLGIGQVNGATWTFNAAGPFSTNDLVAALLNGDVSVEIDSANYPGGELTGSLVSTSGSRAFVAPPPPPALPANALSAPSRTDAARFLTQATYGPTTAEINLLTSEGITKWLSDQMALPGTSALGGLRGDTAEFPNPLDPTAADPKYAQPQNFGAGWWKIAVTAPDQLRQRVAFALSEILVVGDSAELATEIEMKPRYYDILVNDAFGNFRQLLEDVSLNPAMGLWLSHLDNQKADPVKGTSPDENYAREIQQLFTIGLVQLFPDGSLILDAAGQPIPTYNQATISETAKVFTGWSYAGVAKPTFLLPHDDTNPRLLPMAAIASRHDTTQKRVVSLQQVPLDQAQPTIIPANQTAAQDLKVMLDTLVNHPNTGPFIGRQLIQRLVTSNPSAGYIYRVAQVFANDGAGVRGNLGAVVAAILTDYEARSPAVLGNAGYGKVKEPLLRVTGMFRALHAAAPNGRYLDGYFGNPKGFFPGTALAAPQAFFGQQMALWSPSVFNFFTPEYAPAGAVANAGLVAPEMQITDSNWSIQGPNTLVNYLYRDITTLPQPATGASPYVEIDYSGLLPLAKNASALIDQVSLLFCGNQMIAATRTEITAALQALPATATDLERVKTVLHLAIVSPDGAVQK